MSKYLPQTLPDGSTVTYEEVTAKLKETYDKLVKLGRDAAVYRKVNPDFWFLMEEMQPTKQSADYCVEQMKLCARGFKEATTHDGA